MNYLVFIIVYKNNYLDTNQENGQIFLEFVERMSAEGKRCYDGKF